MLITFLVLTAGSSLIPALIGGHLVDKVAEKVNNNNRIDKSAYADLEKAIEVNIKAMPGNRELRDLSLVEVLAILQKNAVNTKGFREMERRELITLIETSDEKGMRKIF